VYERQYICLLIAVKIYQRCPKYNKRRRSTVVYDKTFGGRLIVCSSDTVLRAVVTWRRHSRGNYSAAAADADASQCNYRRRCNNNRISLGPPARVLARRNVESGKINAQLSCSGADSKRRHKQIERDGQMNEETAAQRQRQQQVAKSTTFHSNATHHELCVQAAGVE